jgi:hypothetical protein
MRTYYDSHYPGQKRIITKFLWFPKRILNEKRWLETTSWVEEYIPHWDGSDWYARYWLDNTNFYYRVKNNLNLGVNT